MNKKNEYQLSWQRGMAILIGRLRSMLADQDIPAPIAAQVQALLDALNEYMSAVRGY